MTDAGSTSPSTTGRLLRRATSLAVPVLLCVAGLAVVGPGTVLAVAVGPRLKVTQAVDPTTYDEVGQVLTWTSQVTNFGSTSLRGLEVTDSVPGASDRRCTPVAVGGTLAAGATTSCTATYVVTQADLDGAAPTSDTVTASATTSEQQGPVKASASATAVSTGISTPGLTLTVTASPTSVSRPGQTLAYTFVARNRGDQTVRHVLVTAPFPGLAALVCSPVPQGGTLAPGATTTCRATRTVAVGDLADDALKDAAKVEATTLAGKRVANSGTVSVATKALPPVVTNDTVSAVAGGPAVFLPGARNDRPGETGGSALDPSRTAFVGVDPRSPFDGRSTGTDLGSWSILPDGSVRMQPTVSSDTSAVDTVDYRVYDVAGRSTVGHLRVRIRRGATSTPVSITTLQNQPVTVDVLGHDDPGQQADGSASSFDRTSLRLSGVDWGEDGDYRRDPIDIADDARTISIAGVGVYTARSDGRLTFAPTPGFTGTPPPVRYTAKSVAGVRVENYLNPTVRKVSPSTASKATSVAYGRTAVLAVVTGAKAGDPSAPIDPASVLLTSPTATDAGKTLETYRGTWRVQADGSVRFSPADGFVGTTPAVGYSVADRNRTRTASTMTVTVRPGPTAGADHLSTPKGAAVSVAPLANDVPGTEADGSDGSFVTATLAFPTDGQPAGGAVTDAGHTLTVPDEGVWTAGSGIVTFTPAAGFAGGATPVSYAASDDLGKVARGRITAAVTSEVPAATDDEAATTYATPVRLAGATNDSPGSSSLTSAATVFPAAGQPASATVSTDGKTLTVPGQGTWRLASDGSVTFSPAAGYAGTTAPATYQVVDGAGRTASATLTVVVRPGPAGHPDTVASGYFDVLVPVAQNDTPGRAADGSLGTIDPLTVRFAQTGQPSGWVVSTDGYLATRRLSSDGSSARLAIDTVSGEVDVYVPAGFGGVLGPLVYTASDRVLDATGVARRHPFTSALQVTATRLEPIATDDHAVTTNQVPAFLAGQSNDLPTGEPNLPLQVEGTSFPSDQLGRFPVGSRIDGDQLIVAGEGTYGNNGIDGITFVPVPTFTGDTTPVEYQVEDWLGRTARATLTVTVLPGAVARPDTAATPQDATVNVDVLANDDTGSSLNGVPLTRADFDGAYFASTRQPAGSKLSPYQDKLTVPGQGVYSVNPGNATITFDPESQFRGVASQITVGLHLSVPRASVFAPYQVDLTSTLRVTVVGAVPLAHPDTASTQVGRPVVLKALANDAAGSSTVPLVGSSVRLRLASGLPTGSTLSGDAKRLTVAERGVFLAAGNGDITFVPLGTRTGGVPTIGYQVADANGTTTRSTLTVTVS